MAGIDEIKQPVTASRIELNGIEVIDESERSGRAPVAVLAVVRGEHLRPRHQLSPAPLATMSSKSRRRELQAFGLIAWKTDDCFSSRIRLSSSISFRVSFSLSKKTGKERCDLAVKEAAEKRTTRCMRVDLCVNERTEQIFAPLFLEGQGAFSITGGLEGMARSSASSEFHAPAR